MKYRIPIGRQSLAQRMPFGRPTLAHRVVLALLIAFSLVWIVLAGYSAYQEIDQDEMDSQMRVVASDVLALIASTDDASVASAVVANTSNLINFPRITDHVPGVIQMQLLDAQGRQVFISPEPGAAALFNEPRSIASHVRNGEKFRVLTATSPRWTFKLAVPQFSWVVLLTANFAHGDLNVYLLIAFPLILIPIWFAVASGLRPLKQLSAHIAGKDPNDLTPLEVDAKYAELTPLVGALDHLLQRLRSKITREHAFVQDAAHELRTPLALISAQAHVLALAATPELRLDAQQRLEQAIARASHLIQQLLALAHIDNDAAQTAELIDVAQLTRQEIALMVPAAMARNLDLSLEAPDALQHALHVPTFQSILQNLLANAIAYVPGGGRIVVEVGQQQGQLRLAVSDDGPGIAEAERSLVFERFYRGAGHDAPGSGLGLAIVTQAVARLGGQLQLLAGLEGRGCAFVVALPAPASAAAS